MKLITWLLIILLMAGAGYYGYTNYWASSEIAEFNPQGEQMVYLEGLPQTEKDIFLEEQGVLLLKASYIEHLADAQFIWDESEETMEIISLDTVFKIKLGEGFYMENDESMEMAVPLQRVNGKLYVPMSIVQPLLKVDWIYRDQDKTLLLEEQRICRLVAEVIVEGATIRQDPSIKAPLYNIPLAPGDTLLVYETHEKWLKVRTETGFIGFIHKSEVKRYEECRPGQRPASQTGA